MMHKPTYPPISAPLQIGQQAVAQLLPRLVEVALPKPMFLLKRPTHES